MRGCIRFYNYLSACKMAEKIEDRLHLEAKVRWYKPKYGGSYYKVVF